MVEGQQIPLIPCGWQCLELNIYGVFDEVYTVVHNSLFVFTGLMMKMAFKGRIVCLYAA